MDEASRCVDGPMLPRAQEIAQFRLYFSLLGSADQHIEVGRRGVENDYWFNYQTDLAEARKELTKDLRGSSDAEDNRDAWEEYRAELADARGDYAKEMAEKGYPVGQVRVLAANGR